MSSQHLRFFFSPLSAVFGCAGIVLSDDIWTNQAAAKRAFCRRFDGTDDCGAGADQKVGDSGVIGI
jgi:hypothetical protein